MGITLAGVRLMGTPVACRLSEYLRTIVYRVPGFIVRESHLSPVIVQPDTDFRAAIVTDPMLTPPDESAILCSLNQLPPSS